MTASTRIHFGRLGRAQGLKGLVRLFPGNPDSPLLSSFEKVAVTLKLDTRTLETRVTSCRPGTDNAWWIGFEGIADRTAAESWTHAEVLVDPALFGDTEEGEFFAWQLEGLRLVDPAGNAVGQVLGLDNFGAGDLLRVRYLGREEFIPFAEPWVGEIDLEAGTVVVDAADLFSED